MGVGLRGVVPGEPTEAELKAQLLRCKFWGGAALAALAVCAQGFDLACLQVRRPTDPVAGPYVCVWGGGEIAREIKYMHAPWSLHMRLQVVVVQGAVVCEGQVLPSLHQQARVPCFMPPKGRCQPAS